MRRCRAPSHPSQCAYVACPACIGKYIDTVSVAKCPHPECSQVWSREFFASGGRPLVARYDALLRRNAADEGRTRLPVIQTILSNKRRLAEVDDEIAGLRARIDSLTSERKRIRQANATLGTDAMADAPEPTMTVFCKCPVGVCTGLVTKETMQCTLCATAVCPDCLAPKADAHTCAPDALLSAQEIKKTTRPCPKCAASIFRVQGCDQMWCTACKTPFSWETGKVVTGPIHNPHFFEWKHRAQEQGIAGAAAACEDNETAPVIYADRLFVDVYDALSPITPANYRAFLKAISVLDLAIELIDRSPTPQRPNTLALHLKAANGDIDEHTLAKRVVDRVSKKEKLAEKAGLARIIFSGARSVCLRAASLSPENIELEIDNIVAFYNESLHAIIAKYGGRDADIRFCIMEPSDDHMTRDAFVSATKSTPRTFSPNPRHPNFRFGHLNLFGAAPDKTSHPVLVGVSGRIAKAYYLF